MRAGVCLGTWGPAPASRPRRAGLEEMGHNPPTLPPSRGVLWSMRTTAFGWFL